ncbi:GDSL-type esterase/lipase family protein [Streptomyces sanyensis]|uniref:SGNH/GDSL hydrolase family protein n=1 Tax=Streptomyces sanyensis TaxID=568869 RepID=A0ABP8ZYB2_9ACTN
MEKRQGLPGTARLAALLAAAALIGTGVHLGADTLRRDPAPRTPPEAAAAWVGTWTASPVAAAAPDGPVGSPAGPGGRTVRNVLHTSIGGTAARITLSNLFGTAPLDVSSVTLAVRAPGGGAGAALGTLRRVPFAGRHTATIAPGELLVSDPVALGVPHDGDLMVSIHTPAADAGATTHPRALQTSYVAEGDRTRETSGSAFTSRTPSWHHVTAVDVLTSEARGAVVAVGDSLTDGSASTHGANARWPDHLSDRLGGRYSVLNAGISGNRLLTEDRGPGALDRLDRDVLGRSGVRTVIVAVGINDLLRSPEAPPAAEVVAGYRRLADRARARGLRVVGATLAPCGGHRDCSAAVRAARTEINEAVRRGDIFDAVADFDRALRDPDDPERLAAAYDGGDHLHPGDAGCARMSEAVDPAAL